MVTHKKRLLLSKTIGKEMTDFKPVFTDPNDFARMVAKLPSHIKEEQLIPTPKEQKDIGKFLLYNGLWVSLTYGASLIELFLPWLGKGIRQLIKWRFKDGWQQKDIGQGVKDIIKK